MEKNGEKIVIIGDGEFAEIAYEYFTYDSPYEVVAFSVEENFYTKDTLFGLPVLPFEELEKHYSPMEYKVFVAITFTKFNRVRTRLLQEAKAKGYTPVSYISSRAFVWRDVEIGENCFIFENNVLQYGVRLGNNIVLWSGNHIGHQSVIKDNCFLSSHVVVSGYCEIGENCFLGVNSTLVNNIKIAKDCFIAAGAVVTKNTEEGRIYKGNPAKPSAISALKYFGIEE
ncbi:acetyltransferase [Anoxybacillus geothermalis]|nr:acetyltransferase [Anoxybacillus geothermalis]